MTSLRLTLAAGGDHEQSTQRTAVRMLHGGASSLLLPLIPLLLLVRVYLLPSFPRERSERSRFHGEVVEIVVIK